MYFIFSGATEYNFTIAAVFAIRTMFLKGIGRAAEKKLMAGRFYRQATPSGVCALSPATGQNSAQFLMIHDQTPDCFLISFSF